MQSLCYAIHNQTMFADHKHLLKGALSALKASKAVLSSKAEFKDLDRRNSEL